MQKAYIDSNVFISMIMEEIGKGPRLLFKEAEEFFLNSKGRFVLVFSDFALSEIFNHAKCSKSDIISFFAERKISAEFFESSKEDGIKALEIKKLGIHWSDAFHAAIALRAKCDFIVSFNVKDFAPAGKLIRTFQPLELF